MLEGTLTALITPFRNGALDEETAVNIVSQVLGSLHEAHENGLVHRDLKPSNIMLSEVAGELLVKLVDFGLVHRQDSTLTRSGFVLGTPAYMSPEQCQQAPLDRRSDLYAMGLILYECVAGQAPFTYRNPMRLMMKHISAQPPQLETATAAPISSELANIVMMALSKSPDSRLPNAQSMRNALLNYHRGKRSVSTSGSLSSSVGASDFGIAQIRPENALAQEREISSLGTTRLSLPSTQARTRAKEQPTTVRAFRPLLWLCGFLGLGLLSVAILWTVFRMEGTPIESTQSPPRPNHQRELSPEIGHDLVRQLPQEDVPKPAQSQDEVGSHNGKAMAVANKTSVGSARTKTAAARKKRPKPRPPRRNAVDPQPDDAERIVRRKGENAHRRRPSPASTPTPRGSPSAEATQAIEELLGDSPQDNTATPQAPAHVPD